MKRLAGVALMAGAFVGLTGCTTAKAFKDQAADFVKTDTVSEAVGQKFTDASCAEPDNTDVGTTFECTATGVDDSLAYVFTVEITGKKQFTVQSVEPKG